MGEPALVGWYVIGGATHHLVPCNRPGAKLVARHQSSGQQYPVDDMNHAVVGEDIGDDDLGIGRTRVQGAVAVQKLII
jgi:hypothetical protein